MKKIINAVLFAVVAMTMTACNDEIGGGKNQGANKTQAEYVRDPSTAEQLYGEVVHRATVAPSEKVKILGQDLTADLSIVNIMVKGTVQNPGTMVILACDRRTQTWAFASNIYQDNGQGTENATEFSIMNYKKGLTEIRAADDAVTPFFSTAEGNTDIHSALVKLGKLDPESYITFTVEEVGDDQYSHSIGWSPLFKVDDIVKGLKKVDLSACKGAEPDPTQVVAFTSNEDIRKAAGK